ncbi:MAG: membrane protein of unknown function DUF1049 YciS [Idiomarinaceae bacterium HL-53]|nr:MAG: membrane protein of unknown function DUF1049 YciS [Idiomarinaceae bacterium HL-53]CUS48931.1 putative membrane protein [Idiomarinaceae bacterium HL-53]
MARFFVALIPLLIIFLLALLLGSRNTHLVSVNLLFMQVELKASALMAASILLGFVIGIVAFLSSYIRLRVNYRGLRKELIQHTKLNR